MRNLAVKVPEDLWPEFKARVQACSYAPSRAIARDPADGVVADYEAELPLAASCRDAALAAACGYNLRRILGALRRLCSQILLAVTIDIAKPATRSLPRNAVTSDP